MNAYHMGVFGSTIVGLKFQRRIRVKEIQEAVSSFYGIDERYMTGKDRERRVCRPRQVAMYLARTMTPMSYPEIGRRFGGRDHTTVLHAFRQIEKLSGSDPFLALDVEVLREKLAA
jgi:chromosomal replication initiator protein